MSAAVSVISANAIRLNSVESGEYLTIDQLEPLHEHAFGWALHCSKGCYERAEEVLQNAYLKVVQKRALFDGRSSLKTWWFGVIKFTAYEEARRFKRYQIAIAMAIKNCFGDLGKSETETDDEDVEGTHRVDLLVESIKKLPRRQSDIIHLVYYQSMSISEAAMVMGVSIGTARQHFDRAKNHLREVFSSNAK